MSTFYKIVQGQDFGIRVYSGNSIIIIKDQKHIITFNNVTEDQNNDLWLHVLIDKQNFISAGIKQYQLFENNNLKQSGSLQVIPSLLVDPTQQTRSRYAVIVEAIEAMLAGTATRAQREVAVGDKRVGYMSASQLQSIITYFNGKLDEEEAGNNTNPKTDQLKIKYIWTLR